MNTKDIRIADFNYDLPDERIAKYPLAERDQSKLLIYKGAATSNDNGEDLTAKTGNVTEDHFYNLPNYLPKGALMVFNNTKVIQARLHFQKQTGATIEVFLLEPYSPRDYEQVFQTRGRCEWVCMIGNLKRWKEGELTLTVDASTNGQDKQSQPFTLTAVRKGESGTGFVVEFNWTSDLSFAEVLDLLGELPIPPYLNRKTEASDLKTYQTVYSKIKGSVAAPTAGLHFTERVLHALDEAGIEREELTLHVGAGTFKPVKSEQIAEHEMHSEFIVVKRETIQKLIAHGGQAIAVGTTSVRTLESLYYIGRKLQKDIDVSEDELHVNQWEPYDDTTELSANDALQNILNYLDRHNLPALHTSTQIIIAPGYKYHIVKMMVTNFHQPQSTLLLLVSAFVHGDWHTIYDYAIAHDFRFLSYGDSSLLMP